jgi:GT2 family glycosyltransferase
MPTHSPKVVLDLEVTRPFPDLDNVERFSRAHILCRLRGRPLGFVNVPIEAGRVSHHIVTRELVERHAWGFAVALAARALERSHPPRRIAIEELLEPLDEGEQPRPLVTVAVCTRDRTNDLSKCLNALRALNYPNLDLLVVDNAPETTDTEDLLRRHYPEVRYVKEPRPGLDWARNRAILEARGELLAYTDDDVIVDPGWVSALVRVFTADPEVMAVTGLVIPDELETEAQRLFEIYGGFGRGFCRQWYRASSTRPLAPVHGGTGKFGTGANMAFRRQMFDRIGGFDPALDVGTCTNGGGDLEMFFRVLKHGHTLVYEPAALVRHRHRRTYEQLRTQIANNGIGFYAYLVRTACCYPNERVAIARLGLWWFRWWNVNRFVRALLGKETIPFELIRAELVGSLRGLRRYHRARARAAEIRARYPREPTFAEPVLTPGAAVTLVPEAVRVIDIAKPLTAIDDAVHYQRLRAIVTWRGAPVGSVILEHHGAVVSAMWLADAISQRLTAEVLDAEIGAGSGVLWANLVSELARTFLSDTSPDRVTVRRPSVLPDHIPVSVVVATYDRPADLTRCLESLVTQQTPRPLQIVVVDNHPQSGLTRSVVRRRYPQVHLVDETRGGLSYARNRGIAAATGEIIVCTDDDVTCPPEWIERLVAPFREANVMVVTGNVLPLELESEAQRTFEAYGGLGRGFKPWRVDRDWFESGRRSVPTWQLGCTANAAFRARIFSDPAVGLMDEALGAGTPTGCSEDTYVFYRVLKAGFEIVYEPHAYVWHRHRSTVAALKKQIYAYSKGHVAYHLTTWLRDGDVRGLVRIVYELPHAFLRRTYHRLRGWSDYPMSLIALEILGTIAGPYALWQSRRRVRRLRPSGPPPRRPVVVHAKPADAAVA